MSRAKRYNTIAFPAAWLELVAMGVTVAGKLETGKSGPATIETSQGSRESLGKEQRE